MAEQLNLIIDENKFSELTPLLQEAQEVFSATENSLEELKNKSWCKRLFEAITFQSSKNRVRVLCENINSLMQLQNIVLKVTMIVATKVAEVAVILNSHTEEISALYDKQIALDERTKAVALKSKENFLKIVFGYTEKLTISDLQGYQKAALINTVCAISQCENLAYVEESQNFISILMKNCGLTNPEQNYDFSLLEEFGKDEATLFYEIVLKYLYFAKRSFEVSDKSDEILSNLFVGKSRIAKLKEQILTSTKFAGTDILLPNDNRAENEIDIAKDSLIELNEGTFELEEKSDATEEIVNSDDGIEDEEDFEDLGTFTKEIFKWLCEKAGKNYAIVNEFAIPSGYTIISQKAFEECNYLVSITIPNTVKEIGFCAFCKCKSLKNVVIPDSVTTISNGAFGECDALESVTIGNGATVIGKMAFCYCKSLKTVTIGNSVTSIGEQTFYFCDSLENLAIGNRVSTIGVQAFCGCKSLKNVIIPDSVTRICNMAFDATGLVNVTIPNSVTSLGEGAFRECYSLEKAIISNGIKNIPEDAFSSCSSLRTVKIPNGITTIGNHAFAYYKILGSVKIPDSVTEIGESAFTGCESIGSLVIPNSITTIQKGAFQFCYSLTNVTIPDSVTTISEDAFGNCRALKNVIIGSGITQIGKNALPCDYGYAQRNVTIKAITPPKLCKAFGIWCNDYMKLYVPAESVEAYRQARYYDEKYEIKAIPTQEGNP